MNIALYIDPNISPISTFYILLELKHTLLEKGYNMDIFIPYTTATTTNNDDCWVTYNFAKKLDYPIIWDRLPSPLQYNILLVSHIWNKKWNGVDNRIKLSQSFHQNNKPVLSLKMDTTMEHRFLDNKTLYGVNSKYVLNIEKRWLLPDYVSKFYIPQIANLAIKKSNKLTKKQFYSTYHLDENKKIIIFFMGRFQKWYNIDFINSNAMVQFLVEFDKIETKLNELNCQIIFKLHRSDSIQLIEQYNLNRLTIIDSYHTHEAIRYSSYAFTFASTIVYELYLYNLPVLDLGNGIYYPGWVTDANKKRPLKHLIDYRYGLDLIYGMVVNSNNLFKTISKFIHFYSTKEKIKEYPYLKNHPLFGDSYMEHLEEIADSIINVCPSNQLTSNHFY